MPRTRQKNSPQRIFFFAFFWCMWLQRQGRVGRLCSAFCLGKIDYARFGGVKAGIYRGGKSHIYILSHSLLALMCVYSGRV